MTDVALLAEGLQTYYGKSHILHEVSIEVHEGEIVTLLGRNGAGKTTTLRSLVGLTRAREGAVRIFGQTTTDWPPYRIAALGVGYVPEGRHIFPNLTVDETSQGLAPLIVREVFKVVIAARQEGISVLLVEQNVRAATEIADRAYVLDDGRVVFSGAAAEFARDEERVRALAGASAEAWSGADVAS